MGIVTIRANPGSSWAARAHTRASAQAGGIWISHLKILPVAHMGSPSVIPYDARVFVGRDRFADVRLEFVLGARVEHDDGGDLLAMDGMWVAAVATAGCS